MAVPSQVEVCYSSFSSPTDDLYWTRSKSQIRQMYFYSQSFKAREIGYRGKKIKKKKVCILVSIWPHKQCLVPTWRFCAIKLKLISSLAVVFSHAQMCPSTFGEPGPQFLLLKHQKEVFQSALLDAFSAHPLVNLWVWMPLSAACTQKSLCSSCRTCRFMFLLL